MDKFIPRREVLKVLGIHYHTLYAMVKRGDLEYVKIGKTSMYNLDKYLRIQGISKDKKKICYCRVSSPKQKDDLQRQINYMKINYPGYEIISDIGSGLNYKRSGLKKILQLAINGNVDEIVIAYKDRLTRFGYELIEWIIDIYSNGKITIINKKEEKTPLEEITKDILSIMNIYVAKINGLRKYKTAVKSIINTKE
jgi:predicted site-specific integrase-resolvase